MSDVLSARSASTESLRWLEGSDGLGLMMFAIRLVLSNGPRVTQRPAHHAVSELSCVPQRSHADPNSADMRSAQTLRAQCWRMHAHGFHATVLRMCPHAYHLMRVIVCITAWGMYRCVFLLRVPRFLAFAA